MRQARRKYRDEWVNTARGNKSHSPMLATSHYLKARNRGDGNPRAQKGPKVFPVKTAGEVLGTTAVTPASRFRETAGFLGPVLCAVSAVGVTMPGRL